MPIARQVRPLLAATAQAGSRPVRQVLRRAEQALRGPVEEGRRAPLRPTDLLLDESDARTARRQAYLLGLGFCRDADAAWAALGAVQTIAGVVDAGRRTALVADASGPRSPVRRWLRRSGLEPLSLPAGCPGGATAGLELPPAGLHALTVLHPGGADAEHADEVLAAAAPLLRPHGVVLLTVPLGPVWSGGLDLAGVRALGARAAEHGLVELGSVAPEVLAAAGEVARQSPDAAYGLARLAFRRTSEQG